MNTYAKYKYLTHALKSQKTANLFILHLAQIYSMRKQKSGSLPLFDHSSCNRLEEMQRKMGRTEAVKDEKVLHWIRSERAYYHGTIYTRYANPDGSMGGMVAQDAKIDPLAMIRAGAIVHSMVEIGSGSEIFRGTIIYPRVVIGSGVHIRDDSRIGFGTRIGNGAFLCNNVNVENGVVIGAYANLGAYSNVYRGAVVRDGEYVRPNSMVLRLRQ